MNGKAVAAVVVILVVAAAGSHPKGHSSPAAPVAVIRPPAAPPVIRHHAKPHLTRADKAIAYARAQAGKPYVYGGAGPDSFDCSGLVMMAWQAAGISIPRTSEDQWANLLHVDHLEPGDLIFYAGGDGTVDSPGHVVMYLGGGMVIQAYAPGYPIAVSPLSAMDAGALTGYARPQLGILAWWPGRGSAFGVCARPGRAIGVV